MYFTRYFIHCFTVTSLVPCIIIFCTPLSNFFFCTSSLLCKFLVSLVKIATCSISCIRKLIYFYSAFADLGKIRFSVIERYTINFILIQNLTPCFPFCI